MYYDELIRAYIDEYGNIIDGMPVVDVEDGKNYNEEFKSCEFIGQDNALKDAENKLINIEKSINNFKKQIKLLETSKKKFNDKLLEEMQKRDVWELVVGDVKITRVKSSEQHRLDTKRLKEEMPEVAKMYETITPVSEYVKVKIGGTDND